MKRWMTVLVVAAAVSLCACGRATADMLQYTFTDNKSGQAIGGFVYDSTQLAAAEVPGESGLPGQALLYTLDPKLASEINFMFPAGLQFTAFEPESALVFVGSQFEPVSGTLYLAGEVPASVNFGPSTNEHWETIALSIAERGRTGVGWTTTPNDHHLFSTMGQGSWTVSSLVTAVPEPGALALCSIGLAGLASYVLRKKRLFFRRNSQNAPR